MATSVPIPLWSDYFVCFLCVSPPRRKAAKATFLFQGHALGRNNITAAAYTQGNQSPWLSNCLEGRDHGCTIPDRLIVDRHNLMPCLKAALLCHSCDHSFNASTALAVRINVDAEPAL